MWAYLFSRPTSAALLLTMTTLAAAAVPYEQYILAPDSRSLHPVSVYNVNGSVANADSMVTGGDSLVGAVFAEESAVTYDYGRNIAGVVTLTIGNLSSTDQYIGITFSESSLWISGEFSDATADSGNDEILWFHLTTAGTYTVAREHERGAFRYLSLVHNGTGSTEVTQVETYFTPVPHFKENALRDYTGWFHSEDELINRIWYAGAYTNQLCTIDPRHGDALIHFREITSTSNVTAPLAWYNNNTISNGTSCLVDGAKRDRLIWGGDMIISLPSITVSTYDLVTVRTSLDSLFSLQNKTSGALPYAGVPFSSVYSFTYHLHTLNAAAKYYLYSGDIDWLVGKWNQYKFALNLSLSAIDSSGLMNVTTSQDWLRIGMGAYNIEANSILYYTLSRATLLADVLNDTSLSSNWSTTAGGIKSAANELLWSSSQGLYTDNETTTLAPQDGNSWALLANITANATQATAISDNLIARWGSYGAPAPEASNAVSPFASGFELEGHVAAGNVTAALDLIRLQWGYMLDDSRMTNSSFIEGYSFNGDLHYAAYSNDPRISHAHGWSTGPTSTLTFHVAGIRLLEALGNTWIVDPHLGDLNSVDAGFQTSLGLFSSKIERATDGSLQLWVSAPQGTTGTIAINDLSAPGVLEVVGPRNVTVTVKEETSRVEVPDLTGGEWSLAFILS